MLQKKKEFQFMFEKDMTGVILLPFWLRLIVPSLKITPQIFPEIPLNKYLRIFN